MRQFLNTDTAQVILFLAICNVFILQSSNKSLHRYSYSYTYVSPHLKTPIKYKAEEGVNGKGLKEGGELKSADYYFGYFSGRLPKLCYVSPSLLGSGGAGMD